MGLAKSDLLRTRLRRAALALVLGAVACGGPPGDGAAVGTPGSSLVLALPTATSGVIRTEQVPSALLGRTVRVLVYLPPGYGSEVAGYPTVYLLHGVPGTPDQMFSNLDLAPRLDELVSSGAIPPMVVVVPTGGPTPTSDTEWADSAVHPSQRWGSFLADELVPWVDGKYATCPDRNDRAVAGLSMGGFGAANLALRHRDLFGTASIWSGYFVSNTPSVEGHPGSTSWINDSPLDYVPTLQPSLKALPLRLSFYVGRGDRFYPVNVAFDRLLSQLRVPHRFATPPGGHDWGLWRSQLDRQLVWIGRGTTCTRGVTPTASA